ncbi:MAG: tRNA (adenosine(37)-N6)-threonylcarbamoyltransferase complex ATPase subunit type 1 TsaE [Chlamydiota bacterium]
MMVNKEAQGNLEIKESPVRECSKDSIRSLAIILVQEFPEGAILALYGTLGAGKTTLAKAVASIACGLEEDAVQSPTYTYMHLYEHLVHFDLWRIKDEEEFIAQGFEEYVGCRKWTIIEWPERIETLLPPDTIRINLC